MKVLSRLKHIFFDFINRETSRKSKGYLKSFRRYSFKGNKCNSERQYEAVITRWYHTIEKGLCYENYRAGFGKANIDALLDTMNNYVSDGYEIDASFFQTALSTIEEYIRKNELYGMKCEDLQAQIEKFGRSTNKDGGILTFSPLNKLDIQKLDYKHFVEDRHSLRHFSDVPVNKEDILSALRIAQHTPSACNRQGWSTIVIKDKRVLRFILDNQNGNKGFGQEIDSLLVILGDIRCFNADRELFQVFIDGGMYAQSVLNALHYEHIASVPLSAALSKKQESEIRKALSLGEEKVFIMFVGIGNYPDYCTSTKSLRREADIKIV